MRPAGWVTCADAAIRLHALTAMLADQVDARRRSHSNQDSGEGYEKKTVRTREAEKTFENRIGETLYRKKSHENEKEYRDPGEEKGPEEVHDIPRSMNIPQVYG